AGIDPKAFHLMNILLNTLVCVMVFMTTVKLLEQFLPSQKNIIFSAFAASVLFATHPVHTEVVAWIAAVPELTYSLFCLLSLYLYALDRQNGRTGCYVLSVAAFFIATFCKEPALVLPIVLISYDYCLGKTKGENLVRFRRYIPFFAAAVIYLSIRAFALGQLIQAGKQHQAGAQDMLISVFPLLGEYLAKMLWPVNLNAYTVFTPGASLMHLQGLVAAAGALMFLICLAISFKKSGPIYLGLSLVLLPLVPALYIPALPENIFAERYLYFPSFGFVFLIAFVLTKAKRGMATGTALCVIAVTLLYAFGTVMRNTVWKDNVSFYSDVLSKSPNVPMMHVNLGWTYFKMGRINDALREYNIALAIKPDLADPHNNIGLIYERQNLVNQALQEYKTALALDPDYPAAHNNLGNVYMRLNRVGEAIQEFQTALRLSPRYTAAHFNLGNAYARNGLLNEAVREYKAAIELEPDDADVRNNLGVTYLNLNRHNEAVEQFMIALKHAPGSLPARQNLERARARGL
ncbi:MAG: tetratricopeptide repeat protein, partial [Deltaproteobacteria bacterium]|nr:tetratricopeptide repeat protein [Deltaproteobacteria bacterium]